MSINGLIVPSTNIVACFLSAYYNIQGPHLTPKTNYTKAALASTKFKMDTEFDALAENDEAKQCACVCETMSPNVDDNSDDSSVELCGRKHTLIRI